MSDRLNDYFASEASEYLDQLERLLALPGAPDAEQLLRLATGVRGSAQMAGADTVASVAERLEDAARSILSNNVAWSREIRSLSSQTVADLKLLVRALNRWGPAEERRVREAIVRWSEVETVPEGASEAAVPVDRLFFDDEGPHVFEPGPDEVGEVGAKAGSDDTGRDVAAAAVPIDTLLLRGESALREAVALRPAFERIVRGDAMPERPLAELVEELFDLLDLSLEPDPPEA